jgi:hypothetical protein
MNKLEITGIKLILARIKSKSPKEYALLTHISLALAALCGLYKLIYSTCGLAVIWPSHAAMLGTLDTMCTACGAALTSMGLTAMTTTSDPELLLKEVSDNVSAVKSDVTAITEPDNEKKK